MSFDVRKPFKADKRGLFIASEPATLGAEPPVITEGAGLTAPWEVGVKGKGRPAKTDDNEAELGLLVEAAVVLVEKGEASVRSRSGSKCFTGSKSGPRCRHSLRGQGRRSSRTWQWH